MGRPTTRRNHDERSNLADFKNLACNRFRGTGRRLAGCGAACVRSPRSFIPSPTTVRRHDGDDGHDGDGRSLLKAELKITDAQAPQWNAFADALRANAGRIMEMRKAMMQGGMMPGGMMGQGDAAVSAPDRFDRMEKMMTAMLDAVKATKSALAPLYAVLTDEQKKLADQLIHGPMGMMGGM